MRTACRGNEYTTSIRGGFYVGRKVVQAVSVAKQMRYKGEPSGPRLKKHTVQTAGFSNKKRNSKLNIFLPKGNK